MATHSSFSGAHGVGYTDPLQVQALINQNRVLIARVDQLEKECQQAAIESTRASSKQAEGYLKQMLLQQETHEKIIKASQKALADLRSQYKLLEKTSGEQIEALTLQLQTVMKERDFISSQMNKMGTSADRSKIEILSLQRDLFEAQKKIGMLTNALQIATTQSDELGVQLKAQITKAAHLKKDQLTEKKRLEGLMAGTKKELEAVLTDRNTLASQLPIKTAQEKELKIQLAKEIELRKLLEEQEEMISHLRFKIHELREKSIYLNMRSEFHRTAIEDIGQVLDEVKILIESPSRTFPNTYKKFHEVEQEIRATNLHLYSLKANPDEADFFALCLDVRMNRVIQYGLDPYLLILEKKDHYGARGLKTEDYAMINQPISKVVKLPKVLTD